MLVWKGHRAKLRSLAFSPDGRFIVTTAGNSKFVWLWEATTGKCVRKFTGPDNPLRASAFFPDGQHIIGVHEYRLANVWNIDSGEHIATLEVTSWLHSDVVAIPPDGSRLILFSGSQLVEWDNPTHPFAQPRRCDRTRPPPLHFYFPTQMGYSPRGTYFWACARNFVLYDPATYAEHRVLMDAAGASAQTAAFAPDEARVCVAFGHRAAVWRLDEPKSKAVKLRGHEKQVRAVGFLPGGNTVLTAAMDGTVRLWDADTGTEQRSFDWGIGKVRVAAVSPDGTLCAAGSDDGHLVVWDVDV